MLLLMLPLVPLCANKRNNEHMVEYACIDNIDDNNALVILLQNEAESKTVGRIMAANKSKLRKKPQSTPKTMPTSGNRKKTQLMITNIMFARSNNEHETGLVNYGSPRFIDIRGVHVDND